MNDISTARLLDLKGVQARVPFSRSSIYLKMERGEFPKPIRFSANRVAWDSRDIDAWISEKLADAGHGQ